MKKLSLSILSLLAIIFSVTGAFTSAKIAGGFVATYEIYNVYPDLVSSGCPPYPGPAYHQNLATVFSNSIAQTETIDNWILSINPWLKVADFCQTLDADHVCLVKFKKENDFLTDCLEYKAGDRITQ